MSKKNKPLVPFPACRFPEIDPERLEKEMDRISRETERRYIEGTGEKNPVGLLSYKTGAKNGKTRETGR